MKVEAVSVETLLHDPANVREHGMSDMGLEPKKIG